MEYYDLETKKILTDHTSPFLGFIYTNFFGKLFLNYFTSKHFTNLSSKIIKSKISTIKIKSFIKKNNIDMRDYKIKKYNSFDDFFTRIIVPGRRKLINDKDKLLAVADAKLTVYKIDSKTCMNIKNFVYTVNELINDKKIAKEYNDGYALVFRLCASDYHHYVYVDDGSLIYKNNILGKYHTVQDIALKKYKVFKENHREVNVLKTKNFGLVTEIDVGALNIGKINNYDKESFKKNEEKGFFSFGGSTIVLLFKKGTVEIDPVILKQNAINHEVIVKMGNVIGKKVTIKETPKDKIKKYN